MRLWILPLLLAGCASGPTPTGPDSYMVSAKSYGLGGGVGDAKSKALREASDYCTSKGKVFMVNSGSDRSGGYGRFPEAEVHFLCLDKGDPALRRPDLRPAADTTIEIRK